MSKIKGLLLSLGILNLANFSFDSIADELSTMDNSSDLKIDEKEAQLSESESKEYQQLLNNFIKSNEAEKLKLLSESMQKDMLKKEAVVIESDLMTRQELIQYQNTLKDFWDQSNQEREVTFRMNLLRRGLRNGKTVDPCDKCTGHMFNDI